MVDHIRTETNQIKSNVENSNVSKTKESVPPPVKPQKLEDDEEDELVTSLKCAVPSSKLTEQTNTHSSVGML